MNRNLKLPAKPTYSVRLALVPLCPLSMRLLLHQHMPTTKAPPDLHHQGYKTTLEFHRARTGFFELPALGARTLALVAGQGLAGRRRRRSHTALIHENIRVEAGVEVELLETRSSMAAIRT